MIEKWFFLFKKEGNIRNKYLVTFKSSVTWKNHSLIILAKDEAEIKEYNIGLLKINKIIKNNTKKVLFLKFYGVIME